jgi:hypothetical protein
LTQRSSFSYSMWCVLLAALHFSTHFNKSMNWSIIDRSQIVFLSLVWKVCAHVHVHPLSHNSCLRCSWGAAVAVVVIHFITDRHVESSRGGRRRGSGGVLIIKQMCTGSGISDQSRKCRLLHFESPHY